jgi:hypothetical protein
MDSPPLVLREDGWTDAEWSVLGTCRDFLAMGKGAPPPEAEQLLDVLWAVYGRGHSSRTKRLRKSGLLTRGLGLLSREELYPPGPEGTHLLKKRLDLLFEILGDSPQRPVVDACALVALEQELEERWSRRFPAQGELVTLLAGRERAGVLPLLALVREIDPDAGERLIQDLVAANLDSKRLRLVELVGIVEAWPDPRSFAPLVERSYRAIFAGVNVDDRGRLVGRLFRELTRESKIMRDGRFRLLLDPILADNRTNASVLRHLLELMIPRAEAVGRPYVLLYLETAAESSLGEIDVRAFDYALRAGDRTFLPTLRSFREATTGTFFVRPTARARAAQRAIDAIVEREGLNSSGGALSVVDDGGGRLSLPEGSGGALAVADVQEGPTLPPLPQKGLWEQFLGLFFVR